MNRHSRVHESLLELAWRRQKRRVVDHRKVRQLRNQPDDLPVIVRFVRGNSNGAIGSKGAVHGEEEAFGDETARRMAPLRPWIGKHDIKRGDRINRQEPFDRVGNLEAQDAGIRQAGPLDFATRGPNAAEQALDSQEIIVRILCRNLGKEGAVAAAEIDYERAVPAINRGEIQRRETIRRDELDFAWYGGGRIRGQNVR